MSNKYSTAKIVTAVVAGYVLGRRKKLKLALVLATYMAAKRLNISPQALLKELSALPAVGELKDQSREQVVSVGKDMTDKLVNKWASDLAGALDERTERLVNAPADTASSVAATAKGKAAEKAEPVGDQEEAVSEETGGERAEEPEDSGGTAESTRSEGSKAKRAKRAPAPRRASEGAAKARSTAKSGSAGRSRTTHKNRPQGDDNG